MVDTCGRRSALPAWLADIGARAPHEEREDSGFVYYQRHFQSPSRVLPVAAAGLVQNYPSLTILTLPGDNGSWGVALIASASDRELRALRDVEVWTRVLARYPLAAHWADGEPIEEGVGVVAAVEDRYRRLVIGDLPVATGIVAVGDSWACTNPSLGRGTSIGVLHALALRHVRRDTGTTDAEKLVRRFDEVTLAEIEPLYRMALAYDRHRLAEIGHDIAGREYRPDDPQWALTKALGHLAGTDPTALRAYLTIMMLRATPTAALAEYGVADLVAAAAGEHPQHNLPGPDRATLLAAIRG